MLCPNPDCPHTRRHGRPATYRAGVVACADCGAALADTVAPLPATSVPAGARVGAPAPISTALVARLVVTVAAAAAVPALALLLLPGFDRAVVEAFGQGERLEQLSVGAFGIVPWLTSSLLVEVAALLVPRWRRLRHGDPAARAQLARAATVLGVVVAFAQALMLVIWFSGIDRIDELAPDIHSPGTRLLMIITLVTGGCLARVAVGVIDRAGIGNGFSIIAAVSGLVWVFDAGTDWLWLLQEGREQAKDVVVELVVAVVLGTAAWHLVRVPDAEDPWRVVRPASGIVPATLALKLTAVAALFVDVPGNSELVLEHSAVKLSVVAALVTLPLSLLFSPPRRGARANAAVDGGAVDVDEARSELWRALLPTAALNVLAVVAWHRGTDVVVVVVLVVVVRDLLREVTARRITPDLVAAWPLHRLDLVGPVLVVLRAAGIDASLRGAHHRALFHFFAPQIAIDVLVPASEVARARSLIEALLARLSAPPSLSSSASASDGASP